MYLINFGWQPSNRHRRILQPASTRLFHPAARVVGCVVVLLTLAAAWAGANPVTSDEAARVARHWMWERDSIAQAALTPRAGQAAAAMRAPVAVARPLESRVEPLPADMDARGAYVVVSVPPRGFVIVAADDVAHPVLFYTRDSDFDPAHRPPQFDDMLRGARDAILAARGKGLTTRPEHALAWARLADPAFAPSLASVTTVGPLLTVHWDQGQYYNAQCPADAGGPDGHVWVGCVAASMAQVMRYYSYPPAGQGSFSYACPNYGTLSANFGATTYNWGAMPESLSGPNPDVAQFLFQCGVSVSMDYSTNGSGAYQSDARGALVNHFLYDSATLYSQRPATVTPGWLTMLQTEVDASRPVIYAGYSGNSGHSFVLDGYQGADYFHFNWGWSGAFDGYFRLDELTPDNYDFNSSQEAITRIQPPSNALVPDLVANRAFLASAAVGSPEVAAPAVGDTVFFFADYSYTGTMAATGCQATLTLDGTSLGNAALAVTPLLSHGIVTTGAAWSATRGPHVAQWQLDSGRTLAELDEANNAATCNFVVGSPFNAPLVGMQWQAGTRQNLTWDTTFTPAGGKRVALDLLQNGIFVRRISARTNNDGLQPWRLPKKLVPGDNYQVRITWFGTGTSALSDPFSVTAPAAKV